MWDMETAGFGRGGLFVGRIYPLTTPQIHEVDVEEKTLGPCKDIISDRGEILKNTKIAGIPLPRLRKFTN